MTVLTDSNPEPRDPALQPTHVRYVIVFVTVLMSIILYLDRYCVSFAERYIKEDLALSEHQMALFISAFFWAYGLAQVPAGWLGDRLGCRGVLALYIVSWSIFTALIGFAGGAVMLIAMRLGCGIGQAGAYPTAGSLLSRWVPLSGRGFASALVGLGGRLGAVIAPIMTAYLMVIFVPESTPAVLTEREILNAPALCARLMPPFNKGNPSNDQVPVEQRIVERLPIDARGIVEEYGTMMRDYGATVKVIERDARQQDPSGVPSEKLLADNIRKSTSEMRLLPEELRTLCAGLNDSLGQSDLFSDADIANLPKVESEALGLLKRRQRGEALSAAETIRFNRLMLEALFPAEIGKLYVKGWRPVLFVYGIAGLVIAGLFWLLFRNSPAEHPRCNAGERALIAGDRPAAITNPEVKADRLPAREILRSLSLWLSSISQFATNVAWLFFVTSLPRYLMEVHHVPILERSWMVSIPAMAGIVGMFLGGRLTDRLTRLIGLRWGRALPMGLSRFFAAGAYLACLWVDSPWMATIAFSLGFFFVDLGVSAIWAFMQDVGGKNVGAILGWGNMWGNFGAAVAPHLYDHVLGPKPEIAEWNTMFVVFAAMFVVAGVAALGINATVPIVVDHSDAGLDFQP